MLNGAARLNDYLSLLNPAALQQIPRHPASAHG
ncbi:Uncharacterised protein [Mycobacterium tuberculosis]|nr:Uncharacterised protein [Mycobacterium tuberculosis]